MKENILSQTFILLLACFFYIYNFPFYDTPRTKQKQTIRIVCTAALIPQKYEERKRQYIRSLKKLKEMGYDPYVIEPCQKGPTFLDEYCNHVCYTQSNNPAWARGKGNYGINEAISLNIGLQYFNFDSEDIIIKLTGRYTLEKDEFIRLVENNSQADAVVRAWNEGDAYTGLFAIRLKYFIDFLNNGINIAEMERGPIPLEHFFGAYITKMRKKGAKVFYIPRVYDYLPIWTPHR